MGITVAHALMVHFLEREMKKKTTVAVDPEIAAISTVHAALQVLEPDAQARVLAYVAGKLRLPASWSDQRSPDRAPAERVDHSDSSDQVKAEEEAPTTDADGVSPIAAKWMKRNGLQASELQRFFSLGGDEIDLIAQSVPGKNKKERMRSVLLLKGVAAYLAAGAARFTHEQMKDACLHYDAFDAANFSSYFKSMSGEVTGGKTEGYTLTARGLASATEMVKLMVKGPKAG
jgi:hypothetical protein